MKLCAKLLCVIAILCLVGGCAKPGKTTPTTAPKNPIEIGPDGVYLPLSSAADMGVTGVNAALYDLVMELEKAKIASGELPADVFVLPMIQRYDLREPGDEGDDFYDCYDSEDGATVIIFSIEIAYIFNFTPEGNDDERVEHRWHPAIAEGYFGDDGNFTILSYDIGSGRDEDVIKFLCGPHVAMIDMLMAKYYTPVLSTLDLTTAFKFYIQLNNFDLDMSRQNQIASQMTDVPSTLPSKD